MVTLCTLGSQAMLSTVCSRRWLATRLGASFTGEQLSAFYHAQIAVCAKLAELKPRNYHAWSFRHWLLTKFAGVDPVLLATELEVMHQWCSSHITDHSGWNHRQHVLNLCIQQNAHSADEAQPRKTIKLMLDEHAYLSSILLLYPEHEALWCHRRFIFSVLVQDPLISSDHEWNAETDVIVNEFDPLLALTTDQIDSAWTTIRESFETSVQQRSQALMRESLVAWQCRNRFARRYALWCLDRLQKAPSSINSTTKRSRSALTQLSMRLRDQLKQDDSVLLNLWSVG